MKISISSVSIPAIGHPDVALPDRDDAATSECPDLHSATVSYARRFEGPAGRWMLAVQSDVLAKLMAPWRGARVLDTGGGHGQVGAALAPLGHRIVLHATSPDAVGLGRIHAAEVVHGPLDRAPVADRSVDVAVALRMMPHVEDWRALVAGLCRTADDAVIVDFPIPGGVNALEPLFFRLKQKVEGNTRRFGTMRKAEVAAEFRRNGFEVDAVVGQFVLPMVVHRKLDRPEVSRVLEGLCRAMGLARWIGTPVLMRARRRA